MWVMKMECPRCHSQDALYYLNGRYYCRKCIGFHRVFVDEKRITHSQRYTPSTASYDLQFKLSKTQRDISHQLVMNYEQAKNSLVLAVCGSGKTEIVFELILHALKKGDRVCFCIPRKELVIELYQRIQEAFHQMNIGVAYGGYVENIEAQFIVCTMHQLYRFENHRGFHLMIADEVDAFPFYNNTVLEEIFNNCCLKSWVKLSATFDIEDVQDGECLLIMNRRYHGFDLPTPQCFICPDMIQKYISLFLVKKLKHRVLFFVPKISDIDLFIAFFKRYHILAMGVSSIHTNNRDVISQLKDDKIQVIITTTLLERGITIENVQVIVYNCQHHLFDRRTLIQIAGRVGRKPNHPTGKVYFLANEKTKGMKQCINTIKKLNAMDA